MAQAWLPGRWSAQPPVAGWQARPGGGAARWAQVPVAGHRDCGGTASGPSTCTVTPGPGLAGPVAAADRDQDVLRLGLPPRSTYPGPAARPGPRPTRWPAGGVGRVGGPAGRPGSLTESSPRRRRVRCRALAGPGTDSDSDRSLSLAGPGRLSRSESGTAARHGVRGGTGGHAGSGPTSPGASATVAAAAAASVSGNQLAAPVSSAAAGAGGGRATVTESP